MKILIIDEEFPFPLNSGKRIRSFNLSKALARSNSVSYLAYGRDDSPGFGFIKENGITPHAVKPPDRRKSGIRFYLRLLANLFSPYPYIVTSHFTFAFKEKLERLLSESNYDIVICEWTPYSIFLKDILSVKKIIVAHNIESLIWKRYETNEKNPFKKYYIAIQRKKVERFERNCFGWADGATAVSSREADQIAEFGVSYPVELIENGVDIEYYTPGGDKVDEKTLVFTGSMDWRPNGDAAVYFADKILPLIKMKIPGIKFFIVGRYPSKKIVDLGRIEGVTVTGTVDDVRSYIAGAAVYVVPLRIGGGSRLKILEALAMRKAIVSTSVGAEGLLVENGNNIIIQDDPDRFAEAVIELLGDSALRDKIGASGRSLVENHYRWEKLGERYQGYLQSVADRK